jgi:hypothetical protein
MATFEQFYDMNPISVIDQNKWTVQHPEVALAFRRGPSIYTPLVEWADETERTGASNIIYTELMEGDVDTSEIPLAANYIDDPMGVDSRARSWSSSRYGDKVQMHETINIFQQWLINGKRDWRPLLRGMLGDSVVRKMERLSRNSFLLGPRNYWTFAGGRADFGAITSADTFQVDVVNAWNLRLGQTGSPIIPGDMAGAKLAIMPPGVVYDFFSSLASAATNEAQMWRDAQLYAGKAIGFELGSFKNVRFVQVPNDKFGLNDAILYNCGALTKQVGVSAPILRGDGSPDPETTKVDGVWMVGQKEVTHYIQCSTFAAGEFEYGDFVTIHLRRTNDYGVTNGVDPLDPKAIVRRVVGVDSSNNRLMFDRPVLFDFKNAFQATPQGGAAGNYYAFITKARHVGFILTLGARGGTRAGVARALKFYEPKPIDDFESVWRFVWDIYAGFNIWEPNLFECHFCAVTLPKPGGLISP